MNFQGIFRDHSVTKDEDISQAHRADLQENESLCIGIWIMHDYAYVHTCVNMIKHVSSNLVTIIIYNYIYIVC